MHKNLKPDALDPNAIPNVSHGVEVDGVFGAIIIMYVSAIGAIEVQTRHQVR